MQLSVALDGSKRRDISFFQGDEVTLDITVYAEDGDVTPLLVEEIHFVFPDSGITYGVEFTVPGDLAGQHDYRIVGDIDGVTTTLAHGYVTVAGNPDESVGHGSTYEELTDFRILVEEAQDARDRAEAAADAITQRGIDVEQHPYRASSQSTPTLRLVAIHAARDMALALGVPLIFDPVTYVVEGAVRYKTGCTWLVGGIGRTIFKLSDTAHEDSNVIEPYEYGTVTDVTFVGGFTVNGNYSRPTVTGVGLQRPGSSCFVTAGTKRLQIIGGIEVVDPVLHGLDICGAGQEYDGNLDYVDPDLASPTYYPPNESQYIYIDRVVASNAGDDGVTGHYAKDVHIGRIEATSTGGRQSAANAANCVEIDDGCRRWTIGTIDTVGGNRGVAIKAHNGNPAPSDILIGIIRARECRQGLYIDQTTDAVDSGRRIMIDTVEVTHPVKVNDVAENLTQMRAVAINGVTHVQIGKIIAHANGDEAFELDSGVVVSVNAGSVAIGAVDVRNWPWNNSSVTDYAGVRVASTAADVSIGPMFVKDCGWRALVDTGSIGASYGPLTAVLTTPITGSQAVALWANPSTTGTSIAPFKATGYEKTAVYGTATWSDRGVSVVGSHLAVVGHMNAGDTNDRTYHTVRHAIPDVVGDLIFAVNENSGASSTLHYARGAAGSQTANTAHACQRVAKAALTDRSINVSGTVNTNGLDFAERMRKASGCGLIAKGDICGVTANAELTDKWADAIDFRIKSTDPSFIGGDRWADHLGERPEGPPEAVAAFDAALEEARQTIDIMAFSGQVPVNVLGATPGDFIVAVQDGDGITGMPVSRGAITPEQRDDIVGRVWKVLDDGRAWVRVG